MSNSKLIFFIIMYLKMLNIRTSLPSFFKQRIKRISRILTPLLFQQADFTPLLFQRRVRGVLSKNGPNLFPISLPWEGWGGCQGCFVKKRSQPLSHLPPFGRAGVGVRCGLSKNGSNRSFILYYFNALSPLNPPRGHGEETEGMAGLLTCRPVVNAFPIPISGLSVHTV